MARFTREDDERDEPSRPFRSGGGTVALVPLAVGGVFVLLVVAGLAAMFLFTARSEVREQRMRAEVAEADARDKARASGLIAIGKGTIALPGAQVVRTRDEWTKLRVGKARDEVTELAGEPDRTSDVPPWNWSYDRRSLDPVSDATDATMTVWFRGADGPVERVSFGAVTP